MSIVALTNSSSPVTVERATADSDPYERETQLNGLALNFDAHDHTSAKGLGVGRVQTGAAPAAAGQVRVNGDAWQWWGATAGAVRTALVAGDALSDPVVRDALLLGEQGTALAPDVSLTRTAVGTLTVATAPSGGTPFATRLVLAQAGTLTLSPAALQDALNWGSGAITPNPASGGAGSTELRTGNLLVIGAGGNYVLPDRAAAINMGHPSNTWAAVYAANGTIQPSSSAVKAGITPLDPLACYDAAKAVRWYAFAYPPPAYTAPEPPPDIAYDAADDNETKAEKKALRDEAEAQAKAAHARMLVETAPARHQRGFVYPAGADTKDEAGGTLPPVPDLFGLSDRESTTPQADLATLGCALQHVIARLEALEGAAP
jgi:hypothetical protein